LRDGQYLVCAEAVSPHSHRVIVNQAASVYIGQAFKRHNPSLFGSAAVTRVGLLREALLTLCLRGC
jgi:hypothetical protein